MSELKYPIAADGLSSEAIEAAVSVLRSGRYTMGAHVKSFEALFAERVGAKHAIMVNSGSSANLIAVDSMLKRNGGVLNAGDGVLVPALAWSTTAAPLVQLGLTPVFCDVVLPSMGIDLRRAKQIMDEALPLSRPKALVVVHILGMANDMQSIMEFCENEGLILMEDCCESLGARVGGRHVGAFGGVATHSFFFSHHITTMEGGMVTTGDDEKADTLRALRAHGWIRDRGDGPAIAKENPRLDARFLFSNIGYNVRPTEVQGALGEAQMEYIDTALESRKRLAERVSALLGGHPYLVMLNAEHARLGAECHSWMSIPLLVVGKSRDNVTARMEASGVETRSVIAGNLLSHPAFENYGDSGAHPISTFIADHGFMIGCHPATTEEQFAVLERAVASLRQEAA